MHDSLLIRELWLVGSRSCNFSMRHFDVHGHVRLHALQNAHPGDFPGSLTVHVFWPWRAISHMKMDFHMQIIQQMTQKNLGTTRVLKWLGNSEYFEVFEQLKGILGFASAIPNFKTTLNFKISPNFKTLFVRISLQLPLVFQVLKFKTLSEFEIQDWSRVCQTQSEF